MTTCPVWQLAPVYHIFYYFEKQSKNQISRIPESERCKIAKYKKIDQKWENPKISKAKNPKKPKFENSKVEIILKKLRKWKNKTLENSKVKNTKNSKKRKLKNPYIETS